MIVRGAWFSFFFLYWSAAVWAQIPVLELSKDRAIAEAKQNSERIKSSISDWLAAREQEEASFASLLPRLSLEGTFRYLTIVPSIQLPIPGSAAIPFGANSNYSVGPTLSYSLWDSGGSRSAYKGFQKRVEARQEDKKAATVQLIGSVKVAYAKVQLGLEQLNLIKDSLALAQAQVQDITNRYRAGSSTRLDLLTAQREVLSYQLQFKQQQSDLGASLIDLLAWMNDASVEDPSRPGPIGSPQASVWLKFDSLVENLKKESREIPTDFAATSPQIRSQELTADSLDLMAKSQAAASYPQLQIALRSSLDFPNGPILETINQNTLSASLSIPLFEFNRTRHLAAEKRNEAESARHRRNQLHIDLKRDFAKGKDFLKSLWEQQKDAEESAKQSDLLAHLNYESYRYGRINLIDVEAANVRALQAKFDLARIRAQMLNQIVALKILAGKEN